MRTSGTRHKILAPQIKASHHGAREDKHCSIGTTLKDHNKQRKDIDKELLVGAGGPEGNAHTINMPSIVENRLSLTHKRSSRAKSKISFAMINSRRSEQQANIKHRHLASNQLYSLALINLSLITMIMLANFSGKRIWHFARLASAFSAIKARYRAIFYAWISGQIMTMIWFSATN